MNKPPVMRDSYPTDESTPVIEIPEFFELESLARATLAGGNLLVGRDELFARIAKLYTTPTPLL